jgi:hypothetical protein
VEEVLYILFFYLIAFRNVYWCFFFHFLGCRTWNGLDFKVIGRGKFFFVFFYLIAFRNVYWHFFLYFLGRRTWNEPDFKVIWRRWFFRFFCLWNVINVLLLIFFREPSWTWISAWIRSLAFLFFFLGDTFLDPNFGLVSLGRRIFFFIYLGNVTSTPFASFL